MSLRSLLCQSLRLGSRSGSGPLIAKECRRNLSVSGVCPSRYPKYYIKPIYTEEQLNQVVETGEVQKLAFVPVRAAESDEVQSVWHDPMIARFINLVMRKGEKVVARDVVNKGFETIKRIQLDKYYSAKTDVEREKVILNPWTIFHKAVENCRPMLETMPIKRGGTTYQVPIPVRESKSVFLSMKWLIEACKDKPGTMRFYDKMAIELLDAANDTGRVVKRKQDLHKLCEANRAYAHFRWS